MMQNLSDDNDDEHDDDDDDANGNSFNTNANNRNVHFSNVDNEWDQKALDVLSKIRFTPQEIQWYVLCRLVELIYLVVTVDSYLHSNTVHT